MRCTICSATRVISGAAAAITSSSIRKFNRRMFSGYAAGPAEIDLSSNLVSRFVFDLSVVHLHPLIAPPIITKFLA